jgi:hypothetical protein
LTAFLLAAALADQPPALAELVQRALPDHVGGEYRLADHLGQPVVVMVVNAKRMRLVKDWERDLRKPFPELEIVRIADLPADSDATVEDVRDKYRGRIPDDVPVLIDIDRRWSTGLDLDTGRPNILILDAEGRLVASFWSRFKERIAKDVRAEIQAMLDAP